MNRVWRVALLLAALCAGLGAMTASAGAAGKAGTRDTTFGKGGKVTVGFPAEAAGSSGPQYTLPFEFTPGHLQMAQAPGGKIVVAGPSKIVRFSADGKLDPSFGDGGVVTVPRPPGGIFVLRGVAVDSLGRVILAGLTRPLPTNSTPDPVLSSATVMRFKADGTPDNTFGTGGRLVTDFGLGAPSAGGGPGGKYYGASIGLRDVVVDSQNRILLTGGYVTELAKCDQTVNSKGFIARLTQSGVLDPSFGEGGILALSTIASLGRLAPTASGYLTTGTGGPFCSEAEGPAELLAGFDADGNLESRFASFGFRTLKTVAPIAMSVAPSGKILLLGEPEHRREYHKVTVVKEGKKVTKRVGRTVRFQVVERLLPSGAFDPGFSRIGSAKYVDPANGSFTDLTADAAERTYLVGNLGRRVSQNPHNHLLRRTFVLARLHPKGTYDRSFGNRGSVTTGFGGPSSASATQVELDPKGRVLVGGGIISPELASGGGFAIARYLTGK